MTAGSVLAESARLLMRRPWLFLIAAAVLVPFDVLHQTADLWWVGVLGIFAEPIAYGAVAATALALLTEGRADVVEAFGVAVRRAPVILVASIFAALGTVLGLVLLIFPGLLLLARWSVCVPVLINERAVGLGLGRSWNLVKGRSWVAFWAVFLPALALILPRLGGLLLDRATWDTLDIVGHFLFATYATVVAVVLYRWLITAEADTSASPAATAAVPLG